MPPRRDIRTDVPKALVDHSPSTVPLLAVLVDADTAVVRNQLLAMVRPTIGWVSRESIGGDRYEWSITPAGRAQLAGRETRD